MQIRLDIVDDAILQRVTDELERALLGRRFGRVYAISTRRLAFDLRLPSSEYLYVSTEPNSPCIYLIKRRLRDIDRNSAAPGPFHLLLKKRLSGAVVIRVTKVPDERIIRLEFAGASELGDETRHSLVIQLTGRSSNLFLLDGNSTIVGTLSSTVGDGQETGQRYAAPPKPSDRRARSDLVIPDEVESVSAELDRIYIDRESERDFQVRAAAARNRVVRQIEKRRELVAKLAKDLERHGDAEEWKRAGELLLANLATAKRRGRMVTLIDLFDPEQRLIQIETDENRSIPENADRYFKRYSRARNAADEIRTRTAFIEKEIVALTAELSTLETAIEQGEIPGSGKDDHRRKTPGPKKARGYEIFSGARRFVSSDGLDILVGKKAVDNDQLTFRMASANDLWLHAADYPGSHVIVRNPTRKEIPQNTLLEAARLAAFYSSGKTQPKAAVNHTLRKFVNKPKGAKPGLVRLASFKTILVVPGVPETVTRPE